MHVNVKGLSCDHLCLLILRFMSTLSRRTVPCDKVALCDILDPKIHHLNFFLCGLCFQVDVFALLSTELKCS